MIKRPCHFSNQAVPAGYVLMKWIMVKSRQSGVCFWRHFHLKWDNAPSAGPAPGVGPLPPVSATCRNCPQPRPAHVWLTPSLPTPSSPGPGASQHIPGLEVKSVPGKALLMPRALSQHGPVRNWLWPREQVRIRTYLPGEKGTCTAP